MAFGALSHNYVGVVGGALASWGPIVQLSRSVDVTTSHTTAMGSWEVHSDVGLVSAGEQARIPCGAYWALWGGARAEVLFWGVFGCKWGDSGWVSSIFRPVTPAGSAGPSWWRTGARGVAGTYYAW